MADLNLPTLSGRIDPGIKAALQKIQEWSRGIQSGTGGTGGTTITNVVNNTGSTAEPDLTTPAAPAGFQVFGVFNSIVLSWDYPTWTSPVYSYTEIWRSSTDDLGTAVKVTDCPANVFADVPPDSEVAETYYYWIRHVSDQGVAGPYNATAGTPGTTANNPEYFLQLLTGQITETQLHGDLTSAIDAIPGIQQSITTNTSDIGDLHDQYVLKVNQNGRVSGFGFASTDPVDGDPHSEFIVLADTFAIIDPDDPNGTTTVFPFIVNNGVVYMNIAMIKDATITSAKIANLGVDKLVVGAGGATIPVALIGDATITTAKIADTIQATNYSPGQYGWRITKAGTVEFNQGLFRGAAVFTSPSSGYGQFSDRPLTLAAVNATEGSKLTGIAAGATVGAPSGTYVGNVLADSIATAVTNYSTSNDNDSSAITAPTLYPDTFIYYPGGSTFTGNATIDHVINTDGSATISFEWISPYTAAEIDGFLVHIHGHGTTLPTERYELWDSNQTDDVYEVPPKNRAFVLRGVPANNYYTFGVRAYRKVNSSIGDHTGIVLSAVAQLPSNSNETLYGAYIPSANVAFNGDITGTIDGVDATTVKDNAAAGAVANGYTSDWVKPNETTIDGNKIFTGDAYVDTLQIKGQAVTFTIAAVRDSSEGWSNGGTNTTYTSSNSITITATGSTVPIILTVDTELSATGALNSNQALYFKVYRDDTEIYSLYAGSVAGDVESATSFTKGLSRFFRDTPTAGSHTYYVKVAVVQTPSGNGCSLTLNYCRMLALEAKR